MKSFLQSALSFVALVLVVSAVGLTIEWVRRRGLRTWATEQGGGFEAGAFFAGVSLPEAAAFDVGAGEDKIVYHNVVRIARPGAAYVVAQSQQTYKNTKNEVKSTSCVVCFVTIPGGEFPAVSVYPPIRDFGLGALLGRPAPPAPLRVPDPAAGFADRMEVLPLPGASEVKPDALGRFLPSSVQQELLQRESLIAGLQARGNVVRIQAVGRPTGYPHREVFEVAERLAAHWRADR